MVADSHDAVREFVTTLLQDNGMQVVGEAADGQGAVRLCEQLRPDIAVLDTSMTILSGFEAAGEIARLSPPTRIIFLTFDTIKAFADQARRVGAVGFVSKRRIALDLLDAVEAALRGETYFTKLD